MPTIIMFIWSPLCVTNRRLYIVQPPVQCTMYMGVVGAVRQAIILVKVGHAWYKEHWVELSKQTQINFSFE